MSAKHKQTHKPDRLGMQVHCEATEPVAESCMCPQVCISYDKRPLNLGWTIQNDTWHTWRMLSQPWTTAHVHILPLYVPGSTERSDPKMYSENVRTVMVR
jgi:hypothetical protein